MASMTVNDYIDVGTGGIHVATSWQFAKDKEFTQIIDESSNDYKNVKKWHSKLPKREEDKSSPGAEEYYTELDELWGRCKILVGETWSEWFVVGPMSQRKQRVMVTDRTIENEEDPEGPLLTNEYMSNSTALGWTKESFDQDDPEILGPVIPEPKPEESEEKAPEVEEVRGGDGLAGDPILPDMEYKPIVEEEDTTVIITDEEPAVVAPGTELPPVGDSTSVGTPSVENISSSDVISDAVGSQGQDVVSNSVGTVIKPNTQAKPDVSDGTENGVAPDQVVINSEPEQRVPVAESETSERAETVQAEQESEAAGQVNKTPQVVQPSASQEDQLSDVEPVVSRVPQAPSVDTVESAPKADAERDEESNGDQLESAESVTAPEVASSQPSPGTVETSSPAPEASAQVVEQEQPQTGTSDAQQVPDSEAEAGSTQQVVDDNQVVSQELPDELQSVTQKE